MTGPLILLGVLSIGAGWVGWPGHNLFHHFIHYGETEAEFSPLVATMATSAGLAGIFLGWLVFVKRAISPSLFREKLPWAYNLLKNKYYMDEFYWAVLVVPLFWTTKFFAAFDKWIVDGIVNGVGYITLGISIANSWFDKWVIDGIVNLVGRVTAFSGRILRYAQTGVVQNYLLVVFGCVFMIAVVYLFIPK
jgi:NADH-quinone oxidoreductase subunit L